jgi:hypothetical protein
MADFFRNFFRNFFSSRNDYELVRLVDRRHCDGTIHGEVAQPAFDIICDIDKTYLETEFDSVVDLARTAMEDSRAKVTVFGAREVLLAARWAKGSPPNGLHFVSSSPPQLRRVLEAKLAMDGLDWTSDTFKNQAYNLRKRRLSLLRHHVAYKTLAILSIMEDRGEGGRYVMIGDNAESDPLVYSGVARLLTGRITVDEFQQHLVNAGAQDFETDQIMPLARKVHGKGSVAGIFIRMVPGSSGHKPFVTDPGAWPPMTGFKSFFEVALGMVDVGVLPPDGDVIFRLAAAIHNSGLVPVQTLVAQLRQRADSASSLEVAGAFGAAAVLLEDHMPASWLIRAPLS